MPPGLAMAIQEEEGVVEEGLPMASGEKACPAVQEGTDEERETHKDGRVLILFSPFFVLHSYDITCIGLGYVMYISFLVSFFFFFLHM